MTSPMDSPAQASAMYDRLSPILVKELRQGLRGRVFEGTFLLLQVVLLLAMGSALAAARAGDAEAAAGMGQGFFWFMVAVPLLFILPMRGCGAIRSEAETQALELIFLTRMSARRIVLGKWAALVSQSALFVCAILPYAVLRYYLGRIDIVRDVLLIALLLGLSACLTALTVGVSAFPGRIARAMVFVYPLLLLHGLPVAAAAWLGVGGRVGGGPLSPALTGWRPLAGFVFYGGLALVTFLEIGAARIAPPGENHVWVRRALGAGGWLGGWAGLLLGAPKEILIAHMVLLIPFCIDALCEPRQDLPGVVLPFVRGGRWGRMVFWFALPGWPSGLLYSFLLLGGAAGSLGILFRPGPAEILPLAGVAYALFAPAALVLAFAPRTPRFGRAYVQVLLASLLVSAFIAVVGKVFNVDVNLLYAPLPVGSLIRSLLEPEGPGWMGLNLLLLTAVLGILVIRLIPTLSRMNASWREAVALHEYRSVLRQQEPPAMNAPPP